MSRDIYYYRCESGHELSSPKPMTACVAIIKGSPCTAGLIRTTSDGRRWPEKSEGSTTVTSGAVTVRPTGKEQSNA